MKAKFTHSFALGDVVTFTPTGSWTQCRWIPQHPQTATVQKIFRNGLVAVALHEVYAAGKDGMKTIHVSPQDLATRLHCKMQ